jgi:hypothetical protein
MWRRVFDIHAGVDNPNPTVYRCGLAFGVIDTRNPKFIIGYPTTITT